MDFPFTIDSHIPVIIAGVEPEVTEEVNSAYADMMEELGKSITNKNALAEIKVNALCSQVWPGLMKKNSTR